MKTWLWVLVIVVVLADSSVGQAATPVPKTATVDGEEVYPGPLFTGELLIEVSHLKFYASKLKRNEADCTVVTGYVVSHAPHANYVFTVEIDMWDTLANASFRGTAKAEIDRPVPGKPIRFECLGPAWNTKKAHGEDPRPVKAHYAVRTSVRGYKPPTFKPGTEKAP